ncbi:hypothetical protein OAM69_07165 [bacterium]|nr:hypothetical protein [bacterium]
MNRDARTGRVSSFTRGGQTTRYTYNSERLLASMNQSENGSTFFEYYPDGQLASRSNRGRTVSYEYYPDNSLRKEVFSDLTQERVTREFRYDKYRNLESAVTTSENGSQNNTLTYTYDSNNNVTSQTLSVDGQEFTVSYDYDELSNVTRIQYPNNRRYALDPNSFGKATSIKEIGGQRKTIYDSITYNDNQSMKLMQRIGHEVDNALNSGQRPSKFRIKQYGNNRNSVLGEREYVYDKAANISSINDTVANRFVLFSYDSRNRLTNENISNASNWSFGYLANDNIAFIKEGSLRSNYIYDSSSQRLTGIQSNSSHRRYEYDAQGNMTSHERLQGNSEVTRSLTYNAANQLAAMSDGTTYSYDARGLRVKQDRNGAIYTLYDPDDRLIFRLDSQANVSSEYFYVDGKLVARRDFAENQGGLPPVNPPSTNSGITVSGRTISWPDDGWYQVQSEDGSTNICSGGRSCTVPSAGTYQVVNHTTDVKVDVVIDSDSDSENGITVSGRTISWPDDGWYQVQNEDGSSNICSGGRSCTVPSAGNYQVVNHTTDTKIRVDVR